MRLQIGRGRDRPDHCGRGSAREPSGATSAACAIVKKRQRRLTGVDEMVLSLDAKGLTTGEISAHFAELYGASVSKVTISRITDKVIEEMTDWCSRPLGGAYTDQGTGRPSCTRTRLATN